MNTTFSTTGLAQTTGSTRRRLQPSSGDIGVRFGERRKERRKRQRERAELYRLNDLELMDIGMTRGEIEYVVSNRSIDREQSGPPVR